jgi:hypothetical protein
MEQPDVPLHHSVARQRCCNVKKGINKLISSVPLNHATPSAAAAGSNSLFKKARIPTLCLRQTFQPKRQRQHKHSTNLASRQSKCPAPHPCLPRAAATRCPWPARRQAGGPAIGGEGILSLPSACMAQLRPASAANRANADPRAACHPSCCRAGVRAGSTRTRRPSPSCAHTRAGSSPRTSRRRRPAGRPAAP